MTRTARRPARAASSAAPTAAAHPVAAPAGPLARNAAAVPGALGAVSSAAPFDVHGVTWEPIDASPWHSPIGFALAAEFAAGQASGEASR